MHRITKENIKTILPLTSLQKGMLFHYIEDQSCYYLEQLTVWLKGNIDIDSLKQAWCQCMKQYDILRTVFRWENLKDPVQIVLKNMDISFQTLDYTELMETELNEELNRLKEKERHSRFDLTKCCFNVIFVRCKDNRVVMIFNCLNILYDGWSLGILLHSLFQMYQGIINKEDICVDCRTSYTNYINWYMKQDKEEMNHYWKKYLNDFEEKTKLPYAKGKDTVQHDIYQHEVSNQLKYDIDLFCKQNGVTHAAVYYTAWGYLLQRYNNSNDVIFGSVVSGRNSALPHMKEVVGLLTNCIPFRFKTDENVKVIDAIQSVNTDIIMQGEYEYTSLSEIKRYCENIKDITLFDSIMVIENYPLPNMNGLMDNFEILDYELWEDTNFDLLIRPMNNMNNFMSVQYEKGKFSEESIKLLVSCYEFIIKQMISNSNCNLTKLDICSSYNENVMKQWNNSDVVYDDKLVLTQLFDRIADENGDKIAIECGNSSITYYELQKKSNQFSNYLNSIGINALDRVAIFMERSIEEVIVILGILKANAVCVPLDVDFPMERVEYILNNSEAKCVVKSNNKISFCKNNLEIVYNQEKYNCLSSSRMPQIITADDTVYMIYTSGSTGNPKSAMINSKGIINHAYTKRDVLEVTEQDKLANNFSINVIAAIWQMWTAICASATIVIYFNQLECDIYELLKQSEKDEVSIIEIIPSQLSTYLLLIENGEAKLQLNNLRKIALTSEEIHSVVAHKFYNEYSNIQLVNCYGQTECSDDVLHYVIPSENMPDRIFLGQPARNTRIYILNSYGMKQPIGFIGEICVDGDGVCNGYWRAEELSQDKFVESSYSNNRKIYRTGDLGFWNEDGYVEFRGRCDYQVKIRGNRIELGEIDCKLLELPEIKNAVTIAVKNKNNSNMLRTFYEADGLINPEKIRCELSKKLSPVMIPSEFIFLEHIPALANGKVNRKVLQTYEHSEQRHIERETKKSIEESLYQIVSKVSEIWRKVLRIESIPTDVSFFECGGDSLSILQVKSQIKQIYKMEIPTYEFFRHTTIYVLANLIYSNIKQKDSLIEAKHDDSINKNDNSVLDELDDIAIIGIACRVPDADNIEEFRTLIYEGEDHISTFKQASQSLNTTGHHVNRWGKLKDIDQFDAELFKYSRGEAEITDPQHRVLFECIWEALENAGCNISDNNHIGVFTSSGPSTYLYRNIITNPDIINRYGDFQIEIGNDKDFLATKISYKLNLDGPSINVQTACSSSLLAVHLAAQSLKNKECDIAIAAGVSIHVPQDEGYMYSEGSHMSKSGACRPFEASSDGTVFGNGAGVVILKPYKTARRDNDHIYCILKGSAINNDGNDKISYTAPSVDHQAKVIKDAMKNAKIRPDTIGYIETHGTGTKLGDAIEIAALRQAFHNTNDEFRCAISSVKANIGHLDVASGVIGLCKTALVVESGMIPPSKYFERPNPDIDFGPFYITNKQQTHWPIENVVREAGVSSFGIGGTNVHVIIEQSKLEQETEKDESAFDENSYIISMSGASKNSVIAYRKKLMKYLDDHSDINLKDIAYTLNRRNHRLDYRDSFVCSNMDELRSNLRAEHIIQNVKNNEIIFLFSGQGIDYCKELLEMYDLFPIFKAYVDECSGIILQYMQIEFISSLRNQWDGIGQVDFELQQLAIFVYQYSYAMSLIQLGIHPDTIIGHSFGEYVCACLSGLFTLTDTIYLVYSRASLLKHVVGGAMLSVNLGQKEAVKYCDNEINLAVVNSPEFSVLSGPMDRIKSLMNELDEKHVRFSLLKVNIAYHSKQLNLIVDEFRKLFKNVQPHNMNIAWISTVTGNYITYEIVSNSDYWCNQLCNTVQFEQSILTCITNQEKERKIFVEMNPSNILCNLIKTQKHELLKENTEIAIVTKNKNSSEYNKFLRMMTDLWCYGIDIKWSNIQNNYMAKIIELPNYAFDHDYYWIDVDTDRTSYQRKVSSRNHDEALIYSTKWIQENNENWNIQDINNTNNTTFIFTESEEEYEEFLNKISSSLNERFVRISQGKYYSYKSEDFIEIDKENFTDYITLFEEIQKQTNSLNIVLLLTESVTHKANSIEDFKQSQKAGLYKLAYIAKALQKSTTLYNVQITVVTKDVFDVIGNENLNYYDSTIIAACKVIPQEISWIHCKHIDLTDTMSKRENLEALSSEYMLRNEQHTVAYRYNRRWVQQFKLHENKSENCDSILHENGTYVILGGLGHIGLCLAQTIAQKVNANIILINRSEFVPKHQWEKYSQLYQDDKALKIEILQSIEQMGSMVEVYQADIADEKSLFRIKKMVMEKYGRIHGVIHSAGLVGAKQVVPIEEWTIKDCENHFKAKVNGLFSLNEVFLTDDTMDFCLYMSSLSTTLGGLGTLSYTSANAFMNSYVNKQNKLGKARQICINWDMWQYLKQQNIAHSSQSNGIDDKKAAECINHIIHMNPAESCFEVSIGDLNEKNNIWNGTVVSKVNPQQEQIHTENVPLIYDEIISCITSVWKELFRKEDISINDDFFELGGHSLLAIQMISRIRERYSLSIRVKDIFDYPTIHQLAEFICTG